MVLLQGRLDIAPGPHVQTVRLVRETHKTTTATELSVVNVFDFLVGIRVTWVLHPSILENLSGVCL